MVHCVRSEVRFCTSVDEEVPLLRSEIYEADLFGPDMTFEGEVRLYFDGEFHRIPVSSQDYASWDSERRPIPRERIKNLKPMEYMVTTDLDILADAAVLTTRDRAVVFLRGEDVGRKFVDLSDYTDHPANLDDLRFPRVAKFDREPPLTAA